MALTQDEHDDLRLRLEQVVGEYAAASQRPEAVAKLHGILARVPVAVDAADAPAPETAPSSAAPSDAPPADPPA